jgi:hypothetical protein
MWLLKDLKPGYRVWRRGDAEACGADGEAGGGAG